jgi:hypothetical protein
VTEIEDWPLAGGESNIRFFVEVALEVESSWRLRAVSMQLILSKFQNEDDNT